MDRNQIKYVIYLEKRGGGMEYISTVSHNEIFTSNTTKTILDRELGRSSGRESPFNDNMRIEVLYKDKKIYEVNNIRGFWYSHKESVKYINFPEGKVFYEEYENPAK